MSVIGIDQLSFEYQGGNTRVGRASIRQLAGMESMVLRFEKGYEIPDHLHTKEVVEILLKGRIAFLDTNGKQEIMEAGMMRFCEAIPYRAVVLEESFIMVVQPPGAEVLVKQQSDELGFFVQKVVDNLEKQG